MSDPVYLDYNATTPVAPEVLEAMLPYLREVYGNPSSSHVYGRSAYDGIDRARKEVAKLLGAHVEEIVFTGCATEASNIAILGVMRALGSIKRHVITSAIEHPAVLQPCLRLREDGWDVTILSVDQTGRIDPEAVARVIRADTALVSIMQANNEIGTVQPIAEIARIAHSHGALMHTDAAQSVGKIVVDVKALGVDLLSIAGHKFYAPKGVGALYIRKNTPIASVIVGADHERGVRPGTENVPAIAGLGAAAKIARERLAASTAHLRQMRDLLHHRLAEAIPGLILNGHPELRLPNTLNVSFPGVTGRALLEAAEADVAASLGSACHSESDTVSGVLAALGATIEQALGAVRLSVGTPTTTRDVARAAKALIAAYAKIHR
ncbi:MAG: cysteine desulfurase [Betaproteobacteria bacterium]|nr:cysteine desulfurase [Betaproteobacteria bacterium]